MQKRNEYQNKPYIKRVFIALDQFLNALLFGNPDMTISGRIGWRLVQKKATRPEIWFCKFLRVLESEHCVKSIELDEIRDKVSFTESELISHFSDKKNHYLYDESEESLLLAKNDSTTLGDGSSYAIECDDGSYLVVNFGDTLVYNKNSKKILKREVRK